MAWTATDREAIATYLGYQFQAEALATIQTAMDRLTNLTTTGVIIAQRHLARLDAIAADIDAAATRTNAGVIASADEDAPVEYALGQPLNILRDEGWRYVNLLADVTELVIYKNYFDVPAMKSAIDNTSKASQIKRS